jgi:hypothetical protein
MPYSGATAHENAKDSPIKGRCEKIVAALCERRLMPMNPRCSAVRELINAPMPRYSRLFYSFRED